MLIRKSMKNLSIEKIRKLDDPEIEEAVFRPKMTRLANKIFDFIEKNSNLTTQMGGMSPVITGLDRFKLVELAKGYGIDLFRYMPMVDYYERKMLKAYEIMREDKNS